MDSSHSLREELASLKARLADLEASQANSLDRLRSAIERLEERVNEEAGQEQIPVPPPLPSEPVVVVEPAVEPVAEEPEEAVPMVEAPEEAVSFDELPPVPDPAEEEAPDEPKESMELRIGRVWSVRIGVVALLTGLVLLGNHAYQNWIRDLAPGLRLAGLFSVAFGLSGLGWWLSRRKQVERFGEVLLAGGMAFGYWCTYAAHQVERLKVVDSPAVAAVLLLMAAALIVVIALRRRSSTTAMMGVLMASYSIILQPLGWLAAVSNVILAAAGISLMRKSGWGRVGVLAMLGTYASFTWMHVLGAVSHTNSLPGIWFVAASWALFALPGAAGLVDGFQRTMSERGKAWFIGFNNIACFALISVQWFLLEYDGYWRVPAVFGLVLVALGALTRGRIGGGATQICQGLSMLTLALLLKLDFYQIAVGLGLEALVLAGAFRKFRCKTEGWFSLLAMAGATVTVFAVEQTTMLSAGIVAVLLTGASLLLRSASDQCEAGSGESGLSREGATAALFCAGFVGFFGWLIEFDVKWQAVLAVVISTALGGVHLRIDRKAWLPELGLLAAAFGVGVLGLLVAHEGAVSSFHLLVVALVSVGASLLWERYGTDLVKRAASWIHALAVPMAIALYIIDLGEESVIILISIGVPVLVALFRYLGSSALSTSIALLFLISLAKIFGWQAVDGVYGFIVVVSAWVTLVIAQWKKRSEEKPDRLMHILTRFTALACWLQAWSAVLPQAWLEVIGISTAALWIAARSFKPRWKLPELIVLTLAAGLGFLQALSHGDWTETASASLPHGWGVVLGLALVAFSPALRRIQNPRSKVLAHASFAITCSMWCTMACAGFYGWTPMAIVWTVLGFLFVSLGLLRRMAVLRLCGFMLLTASLLKLFIVDIWAFGTITRVLAFIALGVAMVVLGFFYNHFSSALKRLLASEDEVVEGPET